MGWVNTRPEPLLWVCHYIGACCYIPDIYDQIAIVMVEELSRAKKISMLDLAPLTIVLEKNKEKKEEMTERNHLVSSL